MVDNDWIGWELVQVPITFLDATNKALLILDATALINLVAITFFGLNCNKYEDL